MKHMKLPDFDTVPAAFDWVVRQYGHRTAVLDDATAWTYEQLDALSDSLAARLPEESCIGVILDHGLVMIAAILAVLKAGKAYVPLEPDFPPERIRQILTEAGVHTVITQPDYVSVVPEGTVALCPSLPLEPAAFEPPAISGEDPAYILYTSGSTGRPKGVCVRQRNLMHYVRAFHREFHNGPDDVMLQGSVCTFDIFVEEVFTTLLAGATLAIPATGDFHERMQYCQDHQVTLVSGIPWLAAQMNRERILPESLRLLICGGDTLHQDQIDWIREQIPVYNTYGPSETTVCASYYSTWKQKPLADGTYPIGHPVAGVALEILDEQGNVVAPGQTGEICVYGNGVSAGYIGDHEAENRMFDHDMYHTGDLGYQLPDGNYVFSGRLDRQVMIYGKRVEPEEVERVMERCPGVREAVVTTWMDDAGSSHLHGWIQPEPDADPQLPETLSAFMERYLTGYMIPETVTVVSSFPRTANGKVDSRALKAGGRDA